MVLAVGPRDPALLASFADGQLSSPFGALGGIHDLVAQLVVANFIAHICQRLCDVCLFDFASRRRRSSRWLLGRDRKSTRLNSSHGYISYAVFCLKKKILHAL